LVHRPFYLDPQRKGLFSRAAQKSYFLWKELASKYNLAWSPVGTLEVALDEEEVKKLEQYKGWALENGMSDDEIEVLDSKSVEELEPKVKCRGAIFSKTDTSVDFGELTRFVFKIALGNGLKFLNDSKFLKISSKSGDGTINIQLVSEGGGHPSRKEISANLLINSSGGHSIDIAHELGLAKEYSDLHFRGEYWKVDEPFASKVNRNIYSLARYQEFPFLDPHFVIRPDGTREIGPNATLVFGPEAYKGLSENRFQVISKLFEKPIVPKLRIFTNETFLSLIWHEWRSSISKRAMCDRVKRFIPSIDVSYLNRRGLSGVRSSVIDKNGSFVPEALLVGGDSSFHILNYNSPGATGAPAFSAYVVSKIDQAGYFEGLKRKNDPKDSMWQFDIASVL
jgi:L-2-hydroxyglutarate oxidase